VETGQPLSARGRPQRRFKLILLVGFVLCVALALSDYGLRDYATYFQSPTDIAQNPPAPNRLIRIGGLVTAGSFQADPQIPSRVLFSIGDGVTDLPVEYAGILPDLFREKQGIVIEGTLPQPGKPFHAIRVLAKHDQYYRAPEVQRALDTAKQ
jgi:cytochrome c-type biogenesis protein CcmE